MINVRQRASRQRGSAGFTMVELMIVVAILAIILAIGFPNLVRAISAGNEASAVSSMRALVSVNEAYNTRFGRYAGNLVDMQSTGYIVPQLSTSQKHGYDFNYTASGRWLWSCTADPQDLGTSGDKSFFVDQSGVIRFERGGVTATAASSAYDPNVN